MGASYSVHIAYHRWFPLRAAWHGKALWRTTCRDVRWPTTGFTARLGRDTGIRRRAVNSGGAIHPANSFHSIGRNGGSLLYGTCAKWLFAHPEPGRTGSLVLLHIPLFFVCRSRRLQHRCDAQQVRIATRVSQISRGQGMQKNTLVLFAKHFA